MKQEQQIKPPYVLLLDSNIWVSERMLNTAIGSATLYALAKSGAKIILPEVVDLEVKKILLEMADKAANSIKKDLNFFKQISGYSTTLMVPTQVAVEEAITKRWTQLSGLIEHAPFTFEHARSALSRIIDKKPPCGNNNEQFRDCCIWQCALEKSTDATVYLISNDHAFYDSGSKAQISPLLAEELKQVGRMVKIYPNLNAFLDTVDSEISLDEKIINTKLLEGVLPEARELAGDRRKGGEFELGENRSVKITGYATPEASIVAVSFSMLFEIFSHGDGGELTEGMMSLDGGCSFNPHTNQVTMVEISQWSKRSNGKGSSGISSMSSSPILPFTERNFRIL